MNKESFGTKLGRLFGCVLVSCVAILASTIVIALTTKAIVALLLWLF